MIHAKLQLSMSVKYLRDAFWYTVSTTTLLQNRNKSYTKRLNLRLLFSIIKGI
ncbi:hypothetical protein I79_003828 [Cricetulus griseus]|uniref:Uncharacterized protein n=1 Tax=Cricetulus griseus TaxID=10029 RepID=G3H108_CRIGR|nr:hypothetical protein I79_003828 [Cricetulus griseus]